MKFIAYILLCGMFAVAPMSLAQEDSAMGTTVNPNPPEKAETTTEETTEEAEPKVDEKALKKAANRYWKSQMERKKKGVSILKKVKDKKTARKAAKSLTKLTAAPKKGKDGKDGKDKNARPEDSEFMDAAEKRFLPHIEKLDEAIEEEVARIEEIKEWGSNESAMTDELKSAINTLKNL